jgi:hypothetical protein
MLWFPSKVSRAVYMTANLHGSGKKWWVGAEDAQGRLITAWSQRPETPTTLAQLKFIDRKSALAGKITEKGSKGYIQEAKWVTAHSCWIDTTHKASGTPPMPSEAPTVHTNILRDELIASVKLVGKVSSPTEVVRLDLCKEVDLTSSAVRLDHYEHHHSEVVDYPLWQTIYASAAAAEEAIEAVIKNRMDIGYAVEEKDMSRIFTATARVAIPLIIPGAPALLWDF